MGGNPFETWKKQIKWYSQKNHFKELNRIDRQLTVFEWKIFPRFTAVGILDEIQQIMGKLQFEPENFTSRIIFTSMYNDIVWCENGNTEECSQNSLKVSKYASFVAVVGHSWDLDRKRNGTRPVLINQTELQKLWCSNYIQNPRHPIFRASSAFERGDLESKEHGKKSTQFNDNERNIELRLRTEISVNPLSIYGVIADLCKELNESAAEDSYEDSQSSGTFDTEKGPNEMDILCREYT